MYLGESRIIRCNKITGPSLMRMQEAGAVLWVRWGRSTRREEEVLGPPPGRTGELLGAGCRGGRRPHRRTAGDARRGRGAWGRRGGGAPSLPELTVAGHRLWSGGGSSAGTLARGWCGRGRVRRAGEEKGCVRVYRFTGEARETARDEFLGTRRNWASRWEEAG
jgi:hypothetical protein